MNDLMRLPAGYEDQLRRGSSAVEDRPPRMEAERQHPPRAVTPNPMDFQQMSDMLDAQFRLREAAQAGRVQAIQALIATAEALSPSQWDGEKRNGQNPEEWAPERISEFIVRHVRTEWQRALAAQQPELAAEYERTSRELTDARAEIGRIKLQLQALQASVRTTAVVPARTTQGRHGDQTTEPVSELPDVDAPSSEPEAEKDDVRQFEAVPRERLDAFITLLATTGISRSDEIRERLAADWGVNRGSSTVGSTVRAALHFDLVEAYPCVVEWKGEKKRHFLVLTPAGRARAVELNAVPVESEYVAGLKPHKTPEHLYLVLKAADILRAAGYTDVTYLPECLQVADGEYCPDLAAREAGRPVFIECERSHDKAREAKWRRAAQASGGIIRLVTPNRKTMDAITSEIRATTGSANKIWAFCITEHSAGRRGAGGSIWTDQR